MRSVVVCAAQAPFVTGGAEILVRELAAQLAGRGFRVDVVALPFHAHPPSEVVRQALAWRLVELRHTDGRRPDLVIATKFPSYLVEHPNKVGWLFHQYREAYDLLGTPHSPLADTDEDRAIREDVRALDAAALGECRRLFAISRNVSQRLARFNALPATPLHPPPPHLGRYRCEGYGDYLLWAGRLEPVKRPELALRALAASGPAARLKLAGTGPLEADLRRLAESLGIAQRLEFLGFVADEELLALLAGCRGVLYTPLDEDYGYVPVEGYLSRRPALTTTDAGGPLEFVEDGSSGFVRPPEPGALGEAIDALFALGPAALRELGEQGHARVAHITWDAVIDALAGAAPVRLALWTPRAGPSEWPGRLAASLARVVELVLVRAEPAERPAVDLDLYDVANEPAHGFVYHALRERPGLVLLGEWNLHALVFSATAGRGDAQAYRREARRERAATGRFIARQVLQGTGGALPELLPLNGRVLDASVALVATRSDVLARASHHLEPRPAVLLPLAQPGEPSEAAVAALVALAEDCFHRVADLARLREQERAVEATPLGRALDELRPLARELGLRGLPEGAGDRVAGLLRGLAPGERG